MVNYDSSPFFYEGHMDLANIRMLICQAVGLNALGYPSFAVYSPERKVLTLGNEGEKSTSIPLNDFDWYRIRWLFLQRIPSKYFVSHETPYGDVLEATFRSREGSYAGRVYINGLHVETICDENFMFGYNLNPGWLDVDAQHTSVNRSELRKVVGKIWHYLSDMNQHKLMVEKMLIHNASDLDDFYHATSFSFPSPSC